MLGPKTTGAEVAESTDTADLQQTKAGLKHAALGESPSTTPSVRLSAPDNPSEIASEGPDVPGRGRHLRAVHVKNRPPIFRRDGLADLHGFRHLFNLLFVASNLRLVLENIKKYGVLICISCHDIRRNDILWGIILYILGPLMLFAAFAIEKLTAQHARAQKFLKDQASGDNLVRSPTEAEQRKLKRVWVRNLTAHSIVALGLFSAVNWAIWTKIHHPLIGTLDEMHIIIVLMKTASYAVTNRDLRHQYLHPDKNDPNVVPKLYDSCPYPENISLGNLCYFWWAPTLVYQPVYPRTDRVQWTFVIRMATEVVFISAVIWVASSQYASPLLWNSLDPIKELDFLNVVERILKLSTVSLFIWLCGFYALFHSALNGLAEVMRFGDRQFYDAWWNATSQSEYWAKWNTPVYHWFKRHIYSPMRSRGYNHNFSSTSVFFASSVLHELLVGIPTHMIIGVAFGGMMIQVPLCFFMDRYLKKPAHAKLGNYLFWFFLTIFGQPAATLTYFYLWQAKFGSAAKFIAGEEGLSAIGHASVRNTLKLHA